MASSYAALVSLETLIHTIQDHPDPPISLHSHQVQSLLQILAFLQEFLKFYCHLEEYPTEDLERLIKQVTYTAEDVIESCIVDGIESRARYIVGNTQVHLLDLHTVIEQMDAIKKQALELKKIPGDDDQQPVSSMSAPSLLSPSPALGQTSDMVGFDEVLTDILHRLTRDQSSRRQIIPVVGMGGIGKTTLAAKAYEHGLVKHYFDCRVWVTISQHFVIREILLEIIGLQCPKCKDDFKDDLKGESMEQIGLRIHKSFSRKRYLVIIDDLWSIEAWSMMRPFFPDNCNGSRIVITTRLANVASMAAPNSISIQMNLLDGDKSWDLFCKTVFKGQVCPFELEESGKTIARNCRGLPLSIVVIGGILSKSKQTKRHWEHVASNISSIINLDDNERCLKILRLSYRQLPIHLKPCFLYIGLCPEDERIRVSNLVKLMVAEGFLKPIDGKLIEAVGEKYIQELVDRNLLLVDERGSTGNIKYCRIHDLVRDLCVREAKEENFLYVLEDKNLDIKGDIDMQRQIAVRKMVLGASQACKKLQSAALARSLKWEFERTIPSFTYFKLLRIFNSSHTESVEYDGTFYNLRFFSWVNHYLPFQIIPHMSLLWNLQTVIIEDPPHFLPPMEKVLLEIWKMRQLRHIKVNAFEFHPPTNNFVLSNLQTLCKVRQFECTNDVVEKLPNIHKLVIAIFYERGRYYADYCLNNLQYLHKLEHLQCTIDDNLEDNSRLLGNITFPHSLKKLALEVIGLHWEDMTTMVGSLPNLEKLKLKFIVGSEWRPNEGQFLRLKFLGVSECRRLEHWIADSSHFPILERLNLHRLNRLAEIPPGIGEIPTLKLIQLGFSNHSAVVSAKEIAEEQDAFGNSELQIRILAFPSKDIQLESLASQNFQVKIYEFKAADTRMKL